MRLCLVISVILFFFYVHEVFLCAGTLAYLADSTNGHDDIENEFASKAFGAIAIINILGMIVSVAINQGIKSNLKFGFIVGLTLILVSKLFAQIMIINIGNVFQLIDSQIFKFVVIISFIAEAHALVSFITSYCDEKETQEAEILYDDSVTAIPPGEGPPSYRDATKHVNYETQIVVNA